MYDSARFYIEVDAACGILVLCSADAPSPINSSLMRAFSKEDEERMDALVYVD